MPAVTPPAALPSDQPDAAEIRLDTAFPVGRPRSLDADDKERLCQMILRGATFKQAAAAFACHPETIRNERRRDPEFDAQIRRARALQDIEPLETIRLQAKHSWRAAVWLVQYRERKREERREKRVARRQAAAEHRIAVQRNPAFTAPFAPQTPAKSSAENFSPSPPATPKETLDAMTAVMEDILSRDRLMPSQRAAFESPALRPSRPVASRRHAGSRGFQPTETDAP